MADGLSKSDPGVWRLMPRAPAPGTALGPLTEIADGEAREYVFGRGVTVFSMFVARQRDRVFGYLNICPHYSSRLNCREGQFLTSDRTRIQCSAHFAEFRIEDGFCVAGAAEGCWLDPVPVQVENGIIRINAA